MLLFRNLLLIAAVAQTITLQTFDISVESSQTSVSLGTVLVWIGACYIWVIACSREWCRLVFWAYIKKVRPNVFARYRHWDMENEVFGNLTVVWAIVATIWATVTIVFIVRVIAPATTPISVEPRATLLPLAAFFLVQISWIMSDYRHGETKRDKLDALRPIFHARFSVSEILSMYECIRLAPSVFWNEYKGLPEWRISRATNQEFRNRASSYHVRDSQIHQRTAIIIAVIAVLAATPSLAYLLLEGTLTESISDLFKAPDPP